MKPENAIEVKHISKSFKVFFDKGYTLKEKILFSQRRRYEERKVLDDISFEVKKGEAIGLIGHNGCGKSTMLKILTRIMYPDKGNVEICGRVSSLLELGAGFHPDMTGRQNIYTNAAIFGLTRREIDARLEDIIAFSELEEFIDNPVRTYSSGMYMRLAFSVAINVDADILLIDEILGVGDQSFQQKCFDKLKAIKAEGTTIVIVSHALGQIEQICERSLWINGGIIVAEGAPREVNPQYLEFMGEKRVESAEKEAARLQKKSKEETSEDINSETAEIQEGKDKQEVVQKNTEQNPKTENQKVEKERWGNGKVRIKKIVLLDENNNEKNIFKTGHSMIIKVYYTVHQKVEDAILGIGIFTVAGIRCYGTNTRIDKIPSFNLEESGCYIVKIERLNLLPGEYSLDVAIEAGYYEPIDYYTKAKKFNVVSETEEIGITQLVHTWSLCHKG